MSSQVPYSLDKCWTSRVGQPRPPSTLELAALNRDQDVRPRKQHLSNASIVRARNDTTVILAKMPKCKQLLVFFHLYELYKLPS